MALNYPGQKSAAFVVMLLSLFALQRSAFAVTEYDAAAQMVRASNTLGPNSNHGMYWFEIVRVENSALMASSTQRNHPGDADAQGNTSFEINQSTAGWPVGYYWVMMCWQYPDEVGTGTQRANVLTFHIDLQTNPDPPDDGGSTGGGTGGGGSGGGGSGGGGGGGTTQPGNEGGGGGTTQPGGGGGGTTQPGDGGGDNGGGNNGGNETVNIPGDLPGPGHMAPAPGVDGIEDMTEGTQPGTMDQGFFSRLQGVANGLPGFTAVDQSDWTISLPWINNETKIFILPVFSNPNVNFMRVTLRALLALAVTVFFLWRIINDIKEY